jgi:hypothetical protein
MTNPISQRNLWLRSALAATTVLAAASGLAVACSNSTTTVTAMDSGTDTGTTSDTGTKDTGTKETGTKDTGTKDTGPTTTLYERLGKHAGIRAAVDAIVAQELANADIASYFFFQNGAPGNGHPTGADVEECFTDLVAHAVGGPEEYPSTVETIDGSVVTVGDGGADAGDGGVFYTCRGDMSVVHAPLLISGGTFDKFVAIAGAELAVFDDGGIAPADIATLGAALEGFKTVIVEDGGLDTGLQAFPGNLDGGDGG